VFLSVIGRGGGMHLVDDGVATVGDRWTHGGTLC